MVRLGLILLILVGAAACAGTGADYRPIVDGPMDAQYERDLEACQGLAEQRGYASGDSAATTGIGTAVGAAIGALTGGLSGAATGAGAGAIGGIGGSALQTKQKRERIVVNCMRGRGYRVVE